MSGPPLPPERRAELTALLLQQPHTSTQGAADRLAEVLAPVLARWLAEADRAAALARPTNDGTPGGAS